MKRLDKIYNWTIFIILCLITGFILMYHEPFRDEVQAWDIARDLSAFDIFKQMHFEGHPCLWHFILFPFAKLGCPIYVVSWISYFIMMVTAFLILFKAPFSKLVRTVLVFSSPFIYYYSVISRNYCLIAFCITCICLLYQKRSEQPLLYGVLLFLLFNTHVMMAGMASILLFFFILETFINCIKNRRISWKHGIGCLIGFLGGIVLCLQLVGSYSDNSLVQSIGTSNYGPFTFLEFCDLFMSGYNMEFYYITGYNFAWEYFYIIVGFLLLILCVNMFIHPKDTILFVISYAFYLFVSVVLFYSITPRAIIIIFLLMFVAWICKEEEITPSKGRIFSIIKKYSICEYALQGLLLLFCMLSIPYGIKAAYNDIQHTMTDAPFIAAFIEEHIESDAIILSTNENMTGVIQGYLKNRKFYSVENQRYFSFVTWDKSLNTDLFSSDFDVAVANTSSSAYVLYVPNISGGTDDTIQNLEESGRLELVYESASEFFYWNSNQEFVKFKLYKLLW